MESDAKKFSDRVLLRRMLSAHADNNFIFWCRNFIFWCRNFNFWCRNFLFFLVSKFKVLGICVNDWILHFWGSDEILGNAKFCHYLKNLSLTQNLKNWNFVSKNLKFWHQNLKFRHEKPKTPTQKRKISILKNKN